MPTGSDSEEDSGVRCECFVKRLDILDILDFAQQRVEVASDEGRPRGRRWRFAELADQRARGLWRRLRLVCPPRARRIPAAEVRLEVVQVTVVGLRVHPGSECAGGDEG